MTAACWDCPSIGGVCAICPRTGRTPPEEFTEEQAAKLAEFEAATEPVEITLERVKADANAWNWGGTDLTPHQP